MIWHGPAIALIMHLFAYLYNSVLVRMLQLVHSKVYMVNMIVSEILMNVSQNLLVEYPYFFPQDPKFYSFRSTKIIEIVSQMAYQAKFLLAILMAVHRVWVIWKPIGSEAFSTERLKIYTVVGWIVLFFRQMIIIIPDDCYFKMDLVQFQVMAVCEDKEKHALRLKINSSISMFIHIVLPWTSVVMNILVFFVIKIRKQKNQVNRSSGEKSLIVNSLVLSLLLTANYLYNYFYSMFKPTISQQSHEFQSLFSFFNLYGCICFNFIVYFVLDPTNRKNFAVTVLNRNQQAVGPKTVTTML